MGWSKQHEYRQTGENQGALWVPDQEGRLRKVVDVNTQNGRVTVTAPGVSDTGRAEGHIKSHSTGDGFTVMGNF